MLKIGVMLRRGVLLERKRDISQQKLNTSRRHNNYKCICTPDRSSRYMKHKWTGLKGEGDKY